MFIRKTSMLCAAAVTAVLLLAPAVGQARAHARRVRLKDHCVVKALPAGAKLSVCYPT